MPLWKFLSPKLAHDLAPMGARLYSWTHSANDLTWMPLDWKGLHFKNRLGLAAGVDKDGKLADVWPRLGASFVEIGTITPKPQMANPGKILDRNWDQKLLWNKMGFPGQGMAVVKTRLQSTQKSVPWFINIGKNRDTDNEQAYKDYQTLAENFRDLADAFVINVSSPNTAGLRSLQSSDSLSQLVRTVREAAPQKPILVKLSPDMPEAEFEISIQSAVASGVSGFVLTNTTRARPSGSTFSSEGGLSGSFLNSLSKNCLRSAVKILGNKKSDILLVSVGGILSSADIRERLDLGADLVQVYAALVFNGPGFLGQVAKDFQTWNQLQ